MCVRANVCACCLLPEVCVCECVPQLSDKSAGEQQTCLRLGKRAGRKERRPGSEVMLSHVKLCMISVHFALITINLADRKEIELNCKKRSVTS